MGTEIEPVDDRVELVRDSNGLAVIGTEGAVERFLDSVGLSEEERGQTVARAFAVGGAVAQVGSEVAAHAGRWLKLTEESAREIHAMGLIPTKIDGVSHAMIGKVGASTTWVQVLDNPVSLLTNPAVLTGAAGIMAQLAMQQQMAEITEYLEQIDRKLDQVLRAQTNQVLARLDGVDLAIREAMVVRDTVGRVSEVTWSKVQASAQTIHETQGFALRQLADLADELEGKRKIADLLEATEEATADVQKWLVVLARCFELHDAVGILELDRVLDASPEEIDRHRLGLQSARADRLELISARTHELLDRMDAAAALANSKVLFNPKQSPGVVSASNQVVIEVHELHGVLGIDSSHDASSARRWRDAAEDRWDDAREVSGRGIDGLQRLGSDTLDRAGSVKDRLSAKVADRRARRQPDGDTPE